MPSELASKLRQGLWIRWRKCEAAAAICHRAICAFILDWAACKRWMPLRCAGPMAAKRPLRQRSLTKSLNSKRGWAVDAAFADAAWRSIHQVTGGRKINVAYCEPYRRDLFFCDDARASRQVCACRERARFTDP